MINKGYALAVLVFLVMGIGMVYAYDLGINSVTRIHIEKPESVSLDVRWTDRDLDPNQNITGVIKINGDKFNGDTLTIPCIITNNGSSDLSLSWNIPNTPTGLTVSLMVGDVPWSGGYVFSRNTQYQVSLVLVDDGTLPVGSHVFDLVIQG